MGVAVDCFTPDQNTRKFMKRFNVGDYLLLLGIGLIWGAQFYFNEQALKTIPAMTIAAARILIGGVTLAILSWLIPEKKHPATSQTIWPLYFLIAIFEAVLPMFLIVWGQQRVDSSKAAVLTSTVPIFVMIWSVLFVKGKSLTVNSTLSILVGFLGIIILLVPNMQGNWFDDVVAELAILAAAASFAASLMLLNKIPSGTPIRSVRNILLFAAPPLISLSLFLDHPWTVSWGRTELILLLILGACCSGIVYVLYTVLIHRAGAIFASLTNYVVPLVGVLLGVVLVGEQFTLYNGLALILIISGLALSQNSALTTLIKSGWRYFFKARS